MLTDVIEQLRERGLMGALEEHIHKMMRLAKSSFAAGSGAFLDQKKVEFDLYAQDTIINAGVAHIRRIILEHLSETPAMDVTGELVFVTVITDIERLGDYAKLLLKLSRRLGKPLPKSRYLKELRGLAVAIEGRFDDVERSLLTGDQAVGYPTVESLTQLNSKLRGVFKELLRDTKLGPQEAMGLVMCTRYFKRVVGHLKAAASPAINPFPLIGFKGRKSIEIKRS